MAVSPLPRCPGPARPCPVGLGAASHLCDDLAVLRHVDLHRHPGRGAPQDADRGCLSGRRDLWVLGPPCALGTRPHWEVVGLSQPAPHRYCCQGPKGGYRDPLLTPTLPQMATFWPQNIYKVPVLAVGR